ncbi:MAG: murein L,D-transpeptidase catalytic domain family protein [Saprospiraceae bacterium]|nr:murein L,D-transpeptidase catalytic domain family protein [Saprospiraceae bacterium]
MKNLFRIFCCIILLFGLTTKNIESSNSSYHSTIHISSETENIFNKLNLQSIIPFEAFQKSVDAINNYNITKSIVAICDFTKPSSEKRFTVIDLKNEEVIQHTYVAHGKNSGMLMATQFSNQPESLQSSKGFFRISEQIISPKHGIALMLDGLEKGINDKARMRQIIMHGADYVSNEFIQTHGRLGRSFGCPALPKKEMKYLSSLLRNGALLYIHTKS